MDLFRGACYHPTDSEAAKPAASFPPSGAMPPVDSVETLEREKLALIQRYLEIQDILDDYNEKMYKVCCEIEVLNLRIVQAREAEAKAKAAPAGPNEADPAP